MLKEVRDKARVSLIIETPWIRSRAGRAFANALPVLLGRGVRVRVFYGYSATDENNDPELLEKIINLLGCFQLSVVLTLEPYVNIDGQELQFDEPFWL